MSIGDAIRWWPFLVSFDGGIEIGRGTSGLAPEGRARLKCLNGVLLVSVDGGDWAPIGGSAPLRVAVDITTIDPIENTFPISVELPDGFTTSGVSVVREENITDPSAGFLSPVTVTGWTSTPGRLVLPYVFGLDVDTTYRLTLDVT